MNKPEQSGTGAKSRQHYDETYKRHAVELTLHGDRTVKAVAQELGVAPWALYEWRARYAGRPGDNRPAPRTLAEAEAEIAEFRRFRSLTSKLVEGNRSVCRLRPVEEQELDAHEKKRPKRSKRKSPAK